MNNAQVAAKESAKVIPSSFAALDHALVHGMIWTGVVKWTSQALSWISTIVVARLLAPSDYGLLAMASAALGLIAMVNEFGLGNAIVYQQQLEKRQVAQLNSLALLLSLAGFSVACVVASPLARFYQAPELTWVMVSLGFGFMATGVTSVPSAMLEKALRYKLLAVLEGGQAVLVSVVTLLLAWWDFGYWALVGGKLLGLTVGAIIVVGMFGHPFAFPRLHDIRSILRFSWQLCFGRWCWFVGATSDLFIAGRVLGAAGLGAYSMALTLANMPVDKIASLLSRVTPGLFSSVQSDKDSLKRYFLGISQGVALIVFPIAAGFSLVADDVVRLALGEKWEAAIAPLQILAFYSGIRAIAAPAAPVMVAMGEANVGMWNGVFAMFLLPLAFYIGSYWGAVGIALAWAIAHPMNLAVMFWRVFKGIGLTPSSYSATLWPAVGACCVMALCVVGVQNWFAGSSHSSLKLVSEIIVGALSYAGVILLFHRECIDNLRFFIRTARS